MPYDKKKDKKKKKSVDMERKIANKRTMHDYSGEINWKKKSK